MLTKRFVRAKNQRGFGFFRKKIRKNFEKNQQKIAQCRKNPKGDPFVFTGPLQALKNRLLRDSNSEKLTL